MELAPPGLQSAFDGASLPSTVAGGEQASTHTTLALRSALARPAVQVAANYARPRLPVTSLEMKPQVSVGAVPRQHLSAASRMGTDGTLFTARQSVVVEHTGERARPLAAVGMACTARADRRGNLEVTLNAAASAVALQQAKTTVALRPSAASDVAAVLCFAVDERPEGDAILLQRAARGNMFARPMLGQDGDDDDMDDDEDDGEDDGEAPRTVDDDAAALVLCANVGRGQGRGSKQGSLAQMHIARLFEHMGSIREVNQADMANTFVQRSPACVDQLRRLLGKHADYDHHTGYWRKRKKGADEDSSQLFSAPEVQALETVAVRQYEDAQHGLRADLLPSARCDALLQLHERINAQRKVVLAALRVGNPADSDPGAARAMATYLVLRRALHVGRFAAREAHRGAAFARGGGAAAAAAAGRRAPVMSAAPIRPRRRVEQSAATGGDADDPTAPPYDAAVPGSLRKPRLKRVTFAKGGQDVVSFAKATPRNQGADKADAAARPNNSRRTAFGAGVANDSDDDDGGGDASMIIGLGAMAAKRKRAAGDDEAEAASQDLVKLQEKLAVILERVWVLPGVSAYHTGDTAPSGTSDGAVHNRVTLQRIRGRNDQFHYRNTKGFLAEFETLATEAADQLGHEHRGTTTARDVLNAARAEVRELQQKHGIR